MTDGEEAVLVLRAAGVALVVEAIAPVPRVLHWGADLGVVDAATAEALRGTGAAAVLDSSPDVPRRFTLLPGEHEGWAGTPGLAGHATGTATTPRPRLVSASRRADEAGGGTIVVDLEDAVTAIRTRVTLTLDRFGVLAMDITLTRDASLAPGTGELPYALTGVRALLPVPDRAVEILDFTGIWCRERAPQRGPLRDGAHVRRARRGKPGHDSPYLLVAGTADLGFGRGEAWATHLAWSGDSEYLLERLPEGADVLSAVVGAGENLRPGEVLLHDGDRYEAPTALFVWSGAGLDGVADRLHRRLRARPSHPTSPRPLTLNSWEAVYFDHDVARLSRLVEKAATVGVERFVLDDGWFLGRRDDRRALGDWTVDPGVWPDGLGPLVDLVHARGMQFGLWFEPEMISLDSDLARAHPEWVLGPSQGLGSTSRTQYVIDLAHPEAWAHLLERISAVIAENRIDYLKWDHNRDLVEPVGRRAGADVTTVDRPVVREQTLALYRMLDELRRRHPGLEIESCSGGGARIDLGILQRTDRVWASDCNDPVERLRTERWTRMLVPPELIGSHLGAERAHTTSRRTDLALRLAVALTAHAGIEWDLEEASESDLESIARWTATYRELRELIHTGRVVNADLADDQLMLTGIVAQDGSRALYTWARLASSGAGQSGRVRLPGLEAGSMYRVRARTELGEAVRHSHVDPSWMSAAVTEAGIELPGSVLAIAGIPLPALAPQQALVFDLMRVDD